MEGIYSKIYSSIKRFLWGSKTYHWVKWSNVVQLKDWGELSLRKAKSNNVAMLGKHVWELLHHPNKLWVQLLSNKYLNNSHTLKKNSV